MQSEPAGPHDPTEGAPGAEPPPRRRAQGRNWWSDDFPRLPGVYLFRDEGGRVLYVGKASSLRSRLASYRRPEGDGRYLIRFLADDAASVETIVTRTEGEALLLEDTLIKQHKPPHNVRLKDDKSFRMLRLDLADRFPRLKHVRAHSPDLGKESGRSRYFGPFASAGALRRTVADLHRVVPLRDCPDTVMAHRSRPCLKHQLGLCSAPCVGLVDEAAYGELVERAVKILAGDTAELERDLERRMEQSSADLDYERAAFWRDRLFALRRTVEGQGVRPRDQVPRDVIGLARRGDAAVVHRLAFREGRLAESQSHHFRSELPDEELLHTVLTALYAPGRRRAPEELVLPCAPAEEGLLAEAIGARLVVPTSGERRRMLDLAGENARAMLAREGELAARDELAMAELAQLLDLDPNASVVDCFDVSNLQGTHVVASRVRFRRGHADRAGYRRFRIRDVAGQDDFASMHEAVRRSLARGVKEGDLPDLVVIDGGPQQLARALEARQEAGAFDVPMVALAKARSERTIAGRRKGPVEERLWLPDAEGPLELPKHSSARLLLERMRDEAHRFAITYHRKERGRIESRLDAIPGIGPAKRRALLRTFGSVAGVSAASVEQIGAVAGISAELARLIVDSLRAREGPRE